MALLLSHDALCLHLLICRWGLDEMHMWQSPRSVTLFSHYWSSGHVWHQHHLHVYKRRIRKQNVKEGDNWDTWGPQFSDPDLGAPERKQTEAPHHRGVSVPPDKVAAGSLTYLQITNSVCFPTNGSQLCRSSSVNPPPSAWQRQRCRAPWAD